MKRLLLQITVIVASCTAGIICLSLAVTGCDEPGIAAYVGGMMLWLCGLQCGELML